MDTPTECPAVGQHERTERDSVLWLQGIRLRLHGCSRTARVANNRLADNTTCEPQLKRLPLVGVTSLSREGNSQRGANKLEYSKGETRFGRYGIVNILTEGILRLQPCEQLTAVRRLLAVETSGDVMIRFSRTRVLLAINRKRAGVGANESLRKGYTLWNDNKCFDWWTVGTLGLGETLNHKADLPNSLWFDTGHTIS